MNSRTILQRIFGSLLAVASLYMAGCTKEELAGSGDAVDGNGFRISMVTESMSHEEVVTRASDPKTEAEREIRELHVFLFGADGKYLEAKHDGETHPFQGYQSVKGTSTLRIDNEGFADNGQASRATVYVVANVEPGTFGNLTPEGFPEKIPDRAAFEAFYYEPIAYGTLVELPASGMPMVGKSDATVDLTQLSGEVVIEMKALMARIDFSFEVNSDIGEVGVLPSLNLTNYKVSNMAVAVPFVTPDGESDLDRDGDGSAEKITEMGGMLDPTTGSIIYNKGGKATLSFYVFENLRNPGYNGYPDPYPDYPEGIDPDAKQCYKPMLAVKGNGDTIPATRLVVNGIYTDADGQSYNATCTIYLGSDPEDDFNVKRNHQYRNRVVIAGIHRTNDHPNGGVTFDARINVETTNSYYISLLRHKMDAHFNVAPLDVYLFDKTKRPTMKIEVKNPVENDWIRIERVPASVMENGVAADYQNSNPGQAFAAGTGIRKYFTRDLLTDPAQLANNTEFDGLATRDRVYIYVDENISTKSRTAELVLTYKEYGVPVGAPRTITLEQHGLLKVSVPNDNGRHSYYVYAEAYEEYLNYYDPLLSWQSDQVYDGLPWGLVGIEVNTGGLFSGTFLPVNDAIRGYDEGQKHTIAILMKQGIYGQESRTGNPTTPQRLMVMDEKPASAAEYCYRKNKTDADGTIHYDRMNWFLPTIREQESVMKAYYASTPDFQNFFYWSSNVADGSTLGTFTREATSYARATKAKLENGVIKHIESGHDQYYDENLGSASTGGKANRNTVLRIRAIYRPTGDVEIN